MKIKNIQNGSQDGGQDGGSKLELPITESFMNRFGSNLYSMRISERWVVCLCNEPMAVQSARHDSRLKFLPIT